MKFSAYPVVDLTVAGETLHFEQDNGSMYVGTSVWPSSLVLVKWVEHVLENGLSSVCAGLSTGGFVGKKGVDLGTGVGVAGMGLALLGLNCVLTDIAPVMPALKRNFKKNVGSTSLGKAGVRAGKVKVAHLYWGNVKQVEALKPPFDYVVAGDVVYLENIVQPLLDTMSALSGPQTVIILGYQIRQAEAHELFWRLCPEHFTVVKVPREELHPEYCWPENEVYVLKKKYLGVQG